MSHGRAKGTPKTGGRTKGVPNKTTGEVRAVIAAFATANAERMHEKLNEIADPAKWLDLYLRALEYHMPKLGRTEVTGSNGSPLVIEIVKYTEDDNGSGSGT